MNIYEYILYIIIYIYIYLYIFLEKIFFLYSYIIKLFNQRKFQVNTTLCLCIPIL